MENLIFVETKPKKPKAMTTTTFRNGSGDWTIKTINYPDGWRAIATLNDVNFFVDGFDDEEDAIDAAKDECNQYFLNS